MQRIDAETASVLPSRFRQQESNSKNRVVLIGQPVFNLRIEKAISIQENIEVVASASTMKEALAFPNEFGAELAIVDTDFGGESEGVALSRDINERSPSCAFMLVCSALTPTLAKHLWVFSTDSWSVISQATAKNGPMLAEAVASAVHGMAWVEPGIKREMREYGPRPRSLDERKLAMLYRPSQTA